VFGIHISGQQNMFAVFC